MEALKQALRGLAAYKIIIGFIAMIGVVVVSGLYIAGQSFKETQQQQSPKNPPESALSKEETPDSFMNQDGLEPETKIVRKPPKTEPEPEPEPEPPTRDAFKEVESNTGPSETEQLRQKLRKQRMGQLDIAYVPETIDNLEGRERDTQVWEDTSREEDYSDQDMPETTASYPVDLSRTLTTDNIIPAVLITQINSAVASEKVIAQVEQHVYASHGRKILIPRGSKAIGSYEPLEKTGQQRLQLAWNRIITPEGINIVLNAEAADVYGQAGLTGEVDNRFFDRYGNAMLLASVSAASQLTIGTQSQAAANATESFANEFGTLTEEIIQNNLDISPRVTIKRGTRINISPVTDIWFKEPENEKIEVTPVSQVNHFQQSKQQNQQEASFEIR